jgi:hypothetical protein
MEKSSHRPLSRPDLPILSLPVKLAQELQQVENSHNTVAVLVEVPQVIRVALVAAERSQEPAQVADVHFPVAVGIAEQPEERIDAVTAGHARAGAVQRLPELVVDEAAEVGIRARTRTRACSSDALATSSTI